MPKKLEKMRKAIEKRLKGQKVSKKWQRVYGKTYSPEEAKKASWAIAVNKYTRKRKYE